MLTALSNDNPHCYAWSTEKKEGPFFCKSCLQEVILKKGRVRIHHFAHKPPVTCQYGHGESAIHYKAKREIFESLKTNINCSYCELEKKVNNVIPDIYTVIKEFHIAIEIQKSKMTVQDMYNRTIEHYKNNLSVLWIIPSMDELKIFNDDGQLVSRVHKWIEWLHALTYGRIYVWSGNGENVMPIHFTGFMRYIPPREFYDSEGECTSVGDYYKRLKDRKSVIQSPQKYINIANDFQISHRDRFDTKNYTLPSCLIWHDSLKKWW